MKGLTELCKNIDTIRRRYVSGEISTHEAKWLLSEYHKETEEIERLINTVIKNIDISRLYSRTQYI